MLETQLLPIIAASGEEAQGLGLATRHIASTRHLGEALLQHRGRARREHARWRNGRRQRGLLVALAVASSLGGAQPTQAVDLTTGAVHRGAAHHSGLAAQEHEQGRRAPKGACAARRHRGRRPAPCSLLAVINVRCTSDVRDDQSVVVGHHLMVVAVVVMVVMVVCCNEVSELEVVVVGHAVSVIAW